MTFRVVLTNPHGERQVITPQRIRRFNGAVNEMNAAVVSKRDTLRKRARTGDRVVVGPAAIEDAELAATIVVLITAFPGSEQYPFRYAVEQ